jgi:hypothetical protein
MSVPILEWIRQPQRTKKEIARATIAFKKLVGENFCVSILHSIETDGTYVFWRDDNFSEYRKNKDIKVLMI